MRTGRVIVFVEPIALYHTTDLAGRAMAAGCADLCRTAPPHRGRSALGELGVHGAGKDLAIVTYGNGYYLSRQAEAELRAKGVDLRIIDLRWLHPLNEAGIVEAVASAKKILVVDECRRAGSPSEKLMTILAEAGRGNDSSRLTADDCFIALGPAAELTLPSKASIIEAALKAVEKWATPAIQRSVIPAKAGIHDA
jgi:2-oxoisovalerate dehydrogenase E1 component